MRVHRFYREYPASGVENLGAHEGNFDNLVMYCGMAYNKKMDTTPVRSQGSTDSLFVWSDEVICELKKKGGDLKSLSLMQLHTCGRSATTFFWQKLIMCRVAQVLSHLV